MARLAAHVAPAGALAIADREPSGTIEQLAAARRVLLVTHRRDGRAVPTPVWAARAGDCLYVRTERASGKVKRLRREPRLLVAPCTVRGVPLGAPLQARAEIVEGAGEHLAERALAARYGLGRELFERAMDILRVDMCYLRITPEDGR